MTFGFNGFKNSIKFVQKFKKNIIIYHVIDFIVDFEN